MDFEMIDRLHGDALEVGDIVSNPAGDYLLINGEPEEDGNIFTFPAENLTNTEGEDFFVSATQIAYNIYRSY